MKHLKIIAILFITVIAIFLFANSGRPNVSVKADDKRVTVLESSYCWNEIWRQQCVDYILPPEQIKEKEVIPTVVAPQSNIEIKFNKEPIEEIYVSVWNNEQLGEIEITDNTITAPEESGIYIYAVSGRWSKGSASYVFSVEVETE
ncbi:hypothetical protein ACTHOQ_08045 [Solibacillus silvestris]|uniref:hypothetical protein n=1 Tax=Solibacillus silvestris TaxID=76853 RepID=UPI003F806D54